eukprot:SAG31_NODE_3329_length_4400_cov_2.494071_8_plen_43_part_00
MGLIDKCGTNREIFTLQGSIFIRDAVDCVLHLAGRQVRTRDW